MLIRYMFLPMKYLIFYSEDKQLTTIFVLVCITNIFVFQFELYTSQGKYTLRLLQVTGYWADTAAYKFWPLMEVLRAEVSAGLTVISQ